MAVVARKFRLVTKIKESHEVVAMWEKDVL